MSVVFCCSATLMWRRRTTCNCPPPPYNCYCFYEAKLFMRKFILFCFFTDNALHCITLLTMVIFKLPVFWLSRKLTSLRGTGDSSFSPSPSRHLSLSICLAARAKLHSNSPSTETKPTSLHTCAASARRNDALPRLLRPSPLKKCSSSSCRRCSWAITDWGKGRKATNLQ